MDVCAATDVWSLWFGVGEDDGGFLMQMRCKGKLAYAQREETKIGSCPFYSRRLVAARCACKNDHFNLISRNDLQGVNGDSAREWRRLMENTRFCFTFLRSGFVRQWRIRGGC
ncbi:uncharacterized protein HKW66_Vig0251130 [Vigna angularis]|uniref:Uncharacterized protein n=1 Tax=Phaseolus angularis TaxID=3914 RepID=A0A8T0KXC2_PHAAN|nr:uncharacterized protein HKW66_Vig0251130 [Vigna angularis]